MAAKGLRSTVWMGPRLCPCLQPWQGRGRTWVLWGYGKGKLRRLGCSSGEDVTDVDGNGPMAYIGVQICVKVALVGIAADCAAGVDTCSR